MFRHSCQIKRKKFANDHRLRKFPRWTLLMHHKVWVLMCLQFSQSFLTYMLWIFGKLLGTALTWKLVKIPIYGTLSIHFILSQVLWYRAKNKLKMTNINKTGWKQPKKAFCSAFGCEQPWKLVKIHTHITHRHEGTLFWLLILYRNCIFHV